MLENIDLSLVNWSRGQFALTAMYHWIFIPLTLGLAFIIAIMETIYYKKRTEEWKNITKFWMTLFGINFAIGVATGIILEFQFGTNWSNYSWFVGDIFGAPLAIEGIMAFFLESTFIAVMFFGWNKVSKKFHLISTWLVAIGANLSALWILVANAWMQHPVGMRFNPDMARNEMYNFWEVLLSPFAVNKFLHTISSGFVLAAIFVIGISAWFILKGRSIAFAKKSMVVGVIFGLLGSFYNVFTGDGSARLVAQNQPMKFAAIEGLFNGMQGAPLTAFGIASDHPDTTKNYLKDISFRVEIPNLLSYMAYLDPNAFVPGINDLIEGNPERGILPAAEKIERGKYAREILRKYREAKNEGDSVQTQELKAAFEDPLFLNQYFKYFGYGYIENVAQLVPSIPIAFYSFHLMVGLGFYFIVFFAFGLRFLIKDTIEKKRKFLRLAIFTIPLPYIASQAGWVVAEMGRQPWAIQDLLPTMLSVSKISSSSVQLTFWMFAVLFTALLIAEIGIMRKQIKIGPKEGGNQNV